MLQQLAAGLVGARDPAQPLLTYLSGDARVELSGTTTANWVAKTANLLTDAYGAPERVGLLLPLHWQPVCLLLGCVAAGATVVVGAEAADLEGCHVAFVSAEQAEAVLDVGVDEVLACSLAPLATRLPRAPGLALDAAVELPGHGDHFSGHPEPGDVWLRDQPFAVPPLDVGPADRVMTELAPTTAAGLGALLGALRAGAALVLLADGDAARVREQESVTAWVDAAGLHR